ncbi:MFS transporter [Corynebacterium parakroppenstedtii]|uniref:MFS transporter n=1 Tax=Corynebacterium parakroppenstedtii TaxID=2828363 RepID=UPI001C8F4EA1|nr:MFS transporter [Corynebacterium parakroppenstedtii]MBY0794748.1 MFS transporter [Corynebacterium parakroppenstedtii]
MKAPPITPDSSDSVVTTTASHHGLSPVGETAPEGDSTIVDLAGAEENSRTNIRRSVTSSFIGNFIEWFDYAMYGYLAAVIASVFFPESDSNVGLVLTFGLFAISFLIRPIGAVFWGHIGDRLGRTTTLSWSILLMSGATMCIAFLPGYNHIGILAPLLLLALRLVQGFSAAGEYAGAGTMLTEIAPSGHRGLFAAIVPASTASGLLLGSLLAALLNGVLSDANLHSWGWRIPFLLAAPLGIIGLWIRRHMDETNEFQRAQESKEVAVGTDEPQKSPLAMVWKEPKALGIALAASLLNAIGFYVILSYLPTYLSEELGQNHTDSFIATSVTLFAYIFSVLFTGWLSDRVGRKRIMLTASIAFVITIVPAFMLLEGEGLLLVIVIQLCMGMAVALNDGVLPSFLSEQFSTKVRLSGFALTFNAANAVFGGSAAMVATLLIGWTGSDLAPGFCLMAAAVVTFFAVLAARETSNHELKRG